MKKQDDGSQMDLDLNPRLKRDEARATANILPFVDAATLEIRRSALRRIAQSGIFPIPPNLRGS